MSNQLLAVMKRNITMTRSRRKCKHVIDCIMQEMALSYFMDISLEAMAHPRCVGWGEIGLDYHYDHSPRQIQQEVFIRQLRKAVELRKPLTIHTREAEEDTERILKAEVPVDYRVRLGTLPFITIRTRSATDFICRFTCIVSQIPQNLRRNY